MALIIKGTQTEKNLLTAFSGESQARNRYTYFAAAAKNEGFRIIKDIFEETANQECEHAKRLFKFLQDGEALEITGMFPAGKIGTTAENLLSAAEGEKEEYDCMYPEFAKIAREENLDVIADVFMSIAEAEKYHERRYLNMLDHLKNDTLFKRNAPIVWKCANCGYHSIGTEAPKACPACAHAQGHFIGLIDHIQQKEDSII